jgi:hypothetical protein
MYGSKGWCVVPVLVSILFAQIGCDGGTPAQTPGRYFSQNIVDPIV